MSRSPRFPFLALLLFSLALAFTASPSQATITLDAKADCATSTSGSAGSSCSPATGGESATLSWSHTVGTGAGRILIVGVSMREDNATPNGGTFVSTIKLGAAALTCLSANEDNSTTSLCGSGTSGTFFVRSEVWYLQNPTSGAGTITITTNNATTIAGSSASFSGVLSIATGGVAASQTNNSTGTSTASLAVTSSTGKLVVGNVALAKNVGGVAVVVTSANTNLTDIADNTTSGSHVHGNASDSAAVNPTMSWSFTASGNPANSPWAVAAAILTPSAKHKGEVVQGE